MSLGGAGCPGARLVDVEAAFFVDESEKLSLVDQAGVEASRVDVLPETVTVTVP